MSINLEKQTQNLDYCIGAAHMYSSYKGWMKRPLSKVDLRCAYINSFNSLDIEMGWVNETSKITFKINYL
jgi:hypothetical protein